MNKKHSIMWVDPEFHRVIKANASLNKMKIIDYTRKLAPDFEELIVKKSDVEKKIKNEKKYEFRF